MYVSYTVHDYQNYFSLLCCLVSIFGGWIEHIRGNHTSMRFPDLALFFAFRVILESITAQGWIAWTSQRMQPSVPIHQQNLFLSLFHLVDRQGLLHWTLFRHNLSSNSDTESYFDYITLFWIILYLIFLWNEVCCLWRTSTAISECLRGRLADGPLTDNWPEPPTYVAIRHRIASCRFERPR